MEKSESVHVKNIMSHLSKEQGWRHKLMQCALFDNWEKIVPAEIVQHAVPLKISKNVLWLEVENSVWMQQLQYEKLMLMQTINEFLYQCPIIDIRFSLGEKKKPQKKLPSVTFVAPSQQKIEAFEQQISFIKDAAVRDALMRFWYLCNGCRREEKER